MSVTVVRQPLSGTFGTIRVHYRTLSPVEVYAYLPGGYPRADLADYPAQNGSVVMVAGQEEVEVNITVWDDTLPEESEAVFLMLTRVDLIEGEQERAGNVYREIGCTVTLG